MAVKIENFVVLLSFVRFSAFSVFSKLKVFDSNF